VHRRATIASVHQSFQKIGRFSIKTITTFVAECCTHFPQLLVWERKKKLNLGLKLGEESKIISNKYEKEEITEVGTEVGKGVSKNPEQT